MNALRKLLRLLRIVDLVWLEDYDGEVNLRIKHKTGFKPCAWRYGMGVAKAVLNDDGTVSTPSYVKRWRDYI